MRPTFFQDIQHTIQVDVPAYFWFDKDDNRILGLESIEDLQKRYRTSKAIADLEEVVALIIKCQPQCHPDERPSFVSLESDAMEMINKPRPELDLDMAIRLGRGLVSISTSDNRSESSRKLIKLLMARFQEQDAISDLDELIALHRSIIELHPPGNPTRSTFLHDLARCLWNRFEKDGEPSTLEEAIVFERAALNLRQLGHANRAESLQSLVDLQCLYSKLGKTTDGGELIALGNAILELGPSEYPAYPLSLRELAQLVVTADVQEAIVFINSALKVCMRDHPDRPALLEAIVTYRRKKFKTSAKADRSEVKKLIRDAMHRIFQTLPTRLLNTLTGRLCGRDDLASDFDNSEQYKELLSSIAASHLSIHELIRKTVSTYFKYVTLSHRWGSDEPLLRDVHGQVIYDIEITLGIIKLQSFCASAAKRGYLWAWSDTCCIDKESSAELQEAIGSMFQWYRRSTLTIVHLADVSDDEELSSSEWFKRGWTLQELLAPPTLLFFTQDWLPYGDHSSANHKKDRLILAELEKATNIAPHYLEDFRPGLDDARSRLQWASSRFTTRPEDMAYSLFGVFNVHLPVLYGESKENALGRLLAEIITRSGDISVLDWVGDASPYNSCFPAHINVYQTHPFPSLHSDQMESPMPNANQPMSSSTNELFASLSEINPPQFFGGRLNLPCIVHRVTAIHSKQSQRVTSSYVYEIQAEGLTLSEILFQDEFKNNDSHTTSAYVLVRPWHSKRLCSPTVPLSTTLRQPFHALLLERLQQNEYRRIATSCVIIARATSVESILHNVQTLTIV